MATKIKALKCPQCGSEKHTQLDEKRFRCDSCGTEFYIDDDDININVNHRYDFGKPAGTAQGLGLVTRTSIIAFVIPIVFLIFVVLLAMSTSSRRSSSKSIDSVEVYDQYEYLIPMKHAGKACFFYLVDRSYRPDYRDNKSKYTNGHYYGFRDAQTGAVLAEHLLLSKEKEQELTDIVLYQSEMRYFHQARRWYMLLPKRFIYEVDPERLTVKDVSQTLFAKKQAMSTGLSSAKFLNKEKGEGFQVINNMAEKYCYFPATDRLYTDEAFKYAQQLPPGELGGEQRDSTYCQLQSTDNQLRLWRVSFRFHLGDPQNANYFSYDMTSQWAGDGRLISAEPITGWFTGFNAQIVYQDARYLLLAYNATIATGAPTVFQLRATDGRLLWTKALDRKVETSEVVRIGNRLWLDLEIRYRKKENERHACSLGLTDGSYMQHYRFVTEYKQKAR